MNNKLTNKLVLDYLIYQGYHKIAQQFAQETNQKHTDSSFLLLRSQVREKIMNGHVTEVEGLFEQYNFEFIINTNVKDYLNKQMAIELIVIQKYEETLDILKTCEVEVSDVLEIIVYKKGIDLMFWRIKCAEVVNQVIVEHFGEIKNVVLEMSEEIEWSENKICKYFYFIGDIVKEKID